MAEISAELALLRQQMESLEQRDLGAELPSKQVSATSQNLPQRAREPQEMTENGDMKDLFTQALHPDETLLSRYAAMIYTTTDNGKVYEELAGASMCFSCGERTLLCPHKISGTRVVSVPKHCTHIKICRPHLHRIAMAAKLAANTTTNKAETICERSTSSCAISPVTVIPKRRQAELTQKALGEQPNQSGSSSRWQRSWVTEADFSKLEKHFGNRLKLTREATPRTISLVHCLKIAEQLMVTVFHQQDGRLDHILSVQELLWDLHIKRYIEEEISTLGLQDFLEALRKFSADSKVLCVLGQVLLGELDTATLLYILLQAEILNVFPVTETAQFHCFMDQTYPFLQEAEQDSLVLEFTAYSERVVSPDRVLGFILQLILQRREPFIVECEDMLSFYMKTWSGILTNDELSEALDELAPLTSKTQKHSLIQQSLLSLCSKVIPIHSAAQIAAYVMGRENVQKKRFLSEKNKEHTEIRLKSGAESPEDALDLRSLSNVLKFAQIGQSPCHTSGKDRPQ
ncbi:uncharacterized protein LOC134574477 isoform X1 [Pelobates fuscus]|uniref:uncharacterized protein LOC134574477 isoform X1 n=1 Tax=Pelobates fuscus TaxID=191477 RepID=UPI002FE4D5E0